MKRFLLLLTISLFVLFANAQNETRLSIKEANNGVIKLERVREKAFPHFYLIKGENLQLLSFEISTPAAEVDVIIKQSGPILSSEAKAFFRRLKPHQVFKISSIMVSSKADGISMKLPDETFVIE